MPETDEKQPAATTETSNDARAVEGIAAAETRRQPPSRKTRWLRSPTSAWSVLLFAAVVLFCFAAVTHLIIVPARIILFLAGIGIAYFAAARLCHRVFGRGFDLMFWLCTAWLVLLIGTAAIAPLLPLPEWVDIAKALDEPRYAPIDILSEHPLGTNNYGLDLLARSIYGARKSLTIALFAVLLGTAVGGSIGILAGYFRKTTDRVVGIATNAVLAVPPLILLIALASVLTPNLRNISIALSVLTIPSMIRLARANTMAFAEREFVVAAQAMGASRWRVMSRELLPNVLLPLFSLAMVMISVLIVAEASLSFLGLGIPPPHPTWGNMIAEGQGMVFEKHPQIVLVPGVFLFLTVFSFNLLGEKARKRWDPRSGQL